MGDRVEWIIDPMSFEATAREWVTVLEDHHAKATGHRLPIARRAVARKAGIAPGTLENIRRGRIKEIGRRTSERLRAFMILHLQTQIRKHTRELQAVLLSHDDARDAEIIAAQIALDKARSVLGALAK